MRGRGLPQVELADCDYTRRTTINSAEKLQKQLFFQPSTTTTIVGRLPCRQAHGHVGTRAYSSHSHAVACAGDLYVSVAAAAALPRADQIAAGGSLAHHRPTRAPGRARLSVHQRVPSVRRASRPPLHPRRVCSPRTTSLVRCASTNLARHCWCRAAAWRCALSVPCEYGVTVLRH